MASCQNLQELCFVCSVPPLVAWCGVICFPNLLRLSRETFFSPAMGDDAVHRYHVLMKESSQIPLFDLRKLNASLPVPSPKPPVQLLVLGAEADLIVDAQAIWDTGSFYGIEPVIIQRVAHDMMLDCSWEKGAEAILLWLKDL